MTARVQCGAGFALPCPGTRARLGISPIGVGFACAGPAAILSHANVAAKELKCTNLAVT